VAPAGDTVNLLHPPRGNPAGSPIAHRGHHTTAVGGEAERDILLLVTEGWDHGKFRILAELHVTATYEESAPE
jgi:hypothetical protein